MIIGVLILGSFLGLLASGVALVLGYSLPTMGLVYIGTAFVTVLGVPVACAYRPRRGRNGRSVRPVPIAPLSGTPGPR